MFGPSGEPIRVRLIAKPDGRKRIVAAFGLATRAGQRFALDLMRTQWGDSQYEYARAGRGREAAIQEVLNAVQERNVQCIAEADVSGFFPSISRKALRQSRLLPKAVLKNFVLMDGMETILPHDIDTISGNFPRDGIWQGAISSPYVASKLIEPALSALRGRLGLIYSDNLTIGGATKAEAEMRMDTLASALTKHPAGGFQLRGRRVTSVGGNHDILGYRASRTSPFFGGQAKTKPSRRAINRCERKLLAALIPASSDRYEDWTHEWAEEWPRQFPSWETRQFASGTAEIVANTDVWPLARMIRRATKQSKRTFGSFEELKAFCNSIALLHSEALDWGAIEAAVLNGDPIGMAAAARKSSRLITEDRVLRAIAKIGPSRD
jgi:hypothetical protein